MNSTFPRLEIFVAEGGTLCVAKVVKAESDPRLLLELSLSELNGTDLGVAAQRLGGMVLNILKLWHKKEFEGIALPVFVGAIEDDDAYTLAMQLIERALSEKTAAHNDAIEALLQQAASVDQDAQAYLKDEWPLLRDRLGKS